MTHWLTKYHGKRIRLNNIQSQIVPEATKTIVKTRIGQANTLTWYLYDNSSMEAHKKEEARPDGSAAQLLNRYSFCIANHNIVLLVFSVVVSNGYLTAVGYKEP